MSILRLIVFSCDEDDCDAVLAIRSGETQPLHAAMRHGWRWEGPHVLCPDCATGFVPDSTDDTNQGRHGAR